MFSSLKKIFFTLTFNTALFLLLIITVQNSSQTNKVNLLKYETINLPLSFIIGTSFILGSQVGGLLVWD